MSFVYRTAYSTYKETVISEGDISFVQDKKEWSSVIYLNCSSLGLSTLPHLPETLQILICDHNKLEKINLPKSIRSVYCSHNKLTCLPDFIYCAALENVDFSYNDIQSIQNCQFNSELKTINLSNNLIHSISISKWSDHLVELNLSFNHISELDVTFDHLQTPESVNFSYNDFPCQKYNSYYYISENTNELVLQANRYKRYNIPYKIEKVIDTSFVGSTSYFGVTPLQPRINYENVDNLEQPQIRYENVNNLKQQIINEQPQIDAILNLDRKPIIKSVYNDAHNVHTSSIQSSTNKSLEWVMSHGDPDSSYLENLKSCLKPHFWDIFGWLTYWDLRSLLYKWCADTTIHSVHGISYNQLLGYMWNVIKDHSDKKEIVKVLRAEMLDSRSVCFTGRFTRTLNSLSGFIPEITVGISDREQMQNRIAKVVQHFTDDPAKATEEVTKILVEFQVPENEHSAWLEAI